MIIKITFENSDGTVLLRGGSETGSIVRAEQELEQMATNWMKMLSSGEICEDCEETGWVEIELAPDRRLRKECPHLTQQKAEDDADNQIHDA